MSASLSQLEFHEAVRKQVRILDEFSRSHAGTALFDNPDIEFDPAWCSENFLRFRLARRGSNSVELEFYVGRDGLRLDFDGYPEAWEAPLKVIEEDEYQVKEVLERLITSPILVEYKSGARFVNLFNDNGSRFGIWGLQSFSAMLFRGYWKAQSMDQHLFDPIYPRSK